MPRTRKMRDWVVTVGKRSVTVSSKTYGGACHKAFKTLKLKSKPKTNIHTGGYEGVTAEPLPIHHQQFVKG